jgi:hypothetical protein
MSRAPKITSEQAKSVNGGGQSASGGLGHHPRLDLDCSLLGIAGQLTFTGESSSSIAWMTKQITQFSQT